MTKPLSTTPPPLPADAHTVSKESRADKSDRPGRATVHNDVADTIPKKTARRHTLIGHGMAGSVQVPSPTPADQGVIHNLTAADTAQPCSTEQGRLGAGRANRRGAMGTKLENSARRREENIEKLGAQLEAWSTQLDDLIVGYIRAGAKDSDPYLRRVDALHAQQESVQHKFDAFKSAVGGGGSWSAFRAAIKEDWAALQGGFKDLAADHAGVGPTADGRPRAGAPRVGSSAVASI